MKVAMMQPTFLPWVGYFELMYKSDKIVILDDFQFVYQSYHHKNRLFVDKDKVDWYTVSVDKKYSYLKPINEVKIRNDLKWRETFWKRMENNYSKAKYFYEIKDDIQNIISLPTEFLLEQNMRFIIYVAKLLDCENKICYSSKLNKSGKRSSEVLSILNALNADIYLSAHGSFDYMYEDGIFPIKDIDVYFQNHNPIEYNQVRSKEFVPYLSILDALFNVGPNDLKSVVLGTDKWQSWDEMVKMYKKE